MFVWSSKGKLRAHRMQWLEHNYNYPRYEIEKMVRRGNLRRIPKMERHKESKIEADRWGRQFYPGRTGMWPLNMKPKKKKKGPPKRRPRR